MQRKTVIVLAGFICVYTLGWIVMPVLKKHNDDFPDGFNDRVLHERIKTYPTARGARQADDGAIFALPDWVPDDATDVKIKAQTTGNAKLIRFTLDGTPLKRSEKWACADDFAEDPELDAGWWPEQLGGGAECSDMRQFRVAVDRGHVFAWTDGGPGGA